ncbi:MAG: hypothetical protein B7Y80_01585 [Hyphomicrobium sp. 32-62-53]|nr:MAG: hypothetical protein B7Z29_01935 [Hyphomicrobium sp. 12-62-95]OYY01446.1 MAG: hypothetical protein B7Y80_01585 [Hyphomicrobium sp. 32-62-53]
MTGTAAHNKLEWIKAQAALGRTIVVRRMSFGAEVATTVRPAYVAEAFKIEGDMLLICAGRTKWLSIDNARLSSREPAKRAR